jgi:hypothetical protein
LGLVAESAGQGYIQPLQFSCLQQGDRMLHLTATNVVAGRLFEGLFEKALKMISTVTRHTCERGNIVFFGVVFVDV